VKICEWATTCVATIAEYSMTSGTGGELVRLDALGEQYSVNWHARDFNLNPLKTYRIIVMVGNDVLGFADVDVVLNGSQLKNVATHEFIGLISSRTLPIKFRIEVGAIVTTSQPIWCGVAIDFTQDLLPVPWQFYQGFAGAAGVAGVRQERLDADLGQSGTVIATANQAGGQTRVTIEYDAPFGFGPQFNDQQHVVNVFTSSATFAANQKMEDPCNPMSGAPSGAYSACGLQGKVSTENWTGGTYPSYSGNGSNLGVHYFSAISPEVHRVSVTFSDGASVTSIRRVGDGTMILSNYAVLMPGLSAADIRGVAVSAYSGTWLDNVRVSCE
jgi:hypothetical protein